MNIITCKDAKAQGLKHYFTGVPCKRGHIAERITHNRACTVCDVDQRKKDFASHYQRNKEREKAYRRKHYEENTDAYKASSLRQREKGYPKIWWARNKEHWNFLIASRKAAQAQRTPKWADLNRIKEIYRRVPEDMQVDHIIPLRGRLVSGLHVHNNLQYLTKSENSSKNNKFDPLHFEEVSVC